MSFRLGWSYTSGVLYFRDWGDPRTVAAFPTTVLRANNWRGSDEDLARSLPHPEEQSRIVAPSDAAMLKHSKLGPYR